MLSKQTINELEQAVKEENGCQLEVQTPNGAFTVILQQGRAQRLANNSQSQDDINAGSQFGSTAQQQQRRGQQQEWRVRKISPQGSVYQD